MAKAADNTIYCGPCESQHLTNVADLWCPNCDEGLCSKCMEYHKVSRSSRMHKTITIENLMILPDFVRNIDHFCSSHDGVRELYCNVHEKTCCADCVCFEHFECPGITLLTKVVQGVKESAFYHSIVKSIENITDYVTKLQKNRYKNVVTLQKEKDNLIEKVKSKRSEIASHLDRIEEHLLRQIDSAITKESQQINEAASYLQKKINILMEYKSHISTIIENASDVQAFLGLKEIERNIAYEEENLVSITEAPGMKETSVKMEFTNEIGGLVQELNVMGNLEIIKVSTGMPFSGVKSQLAKCLYDIQSGIEHIKLNYLSSFQLPFDTDINICGCVILDDERVILANKNSNNSTGGLHIFRESGEYLERIFCPSKPSGISIINRSSIAVAFCEEYCIKVYHSENFKIKQKLSYGYYFCGLSVESECLVSAIRDDGIFFIKCSDGNILKVLPSYIEHLSYVHIKRGNTLVSDETNHTVHCLNRDGETVWKFSSHAMKGPKDICTDAFGNIFVAACDSQSFIAISSDGKTCKKLLGVEDGLKNPKALYFSEITSSLLVASQQGFALKYNLSYF